MASVVGLAGVAAALLYSGAQTKALRRQATLQTEQQGRSGDVARAALDWRLGQMMIDMHNVFVQRPDLYPYLNENAPTPPPGDPFRAAVLSCAEMIINVVEVI